MTPRTAALFAPLAVALGPHVLLALFAVVLASAAGLLAFGIIPAGRRNGWALVTAVSIRRPPP